MNAPLSQRAKLLLDQGKLAAAENLCREALSANPESMDALHMLALVMVRQGAVAEAEALLRQLLVGHPGQSEIRFNLGNLLRRQGHLEQAALEYQQVLSRQPEFRPARLALMRLCNQQGKGAAAEQHARELLRQNAADAEAHAGLGVALRELGRYVESEAAYRQALALQPGYAVARHNLGALLSHLERAEESLVELQRAGRDGARGAQLHFNCARALIDLERFADAEAELIRLVQLDSTHVPGQLMLAKLRFSLGDRDCARDLLASVQRQPSVPLHLAAAQVLRASGALSRAEDLLLRGLSKMQSPLLLVELAGLMQEMARGQEAVAAASQAWQLQRAEPMAAALVSALLGVGSADHALAVIDEVLARRPFDQLFLAYRASAARQLQLPYYRTLYDYETFVRVTDIDTPAGWSTQAEFLRDLASVLRTRHQMRSHPLDQSLRNGTQTARSLLVDSAVVVKAFLQSLQRPLADYQSALPRDPTHPMCSRNLGSATLSGCWSVNLHSGGYHVNHVHPNGWLSSAFYVDLPAEIEDPAACQGWLKFGEPRYVFPTVTADKFVQPRAGRLVLFPSYLWHGTTAIHGDGSRLTIAFDAVTTPQ